MKNTSGLTISMLIPCHNEEEMVARCIDSCLAQTRPLDEIIVVNDGSTDNSAAILASYGNKIRVITIPKATGNKSRAQEIGFKSITTDIFIATDGDTIIHPNFTKEIEQDFIKHPHIHAVAGYVKSLRYNYLTALREIDYTVGQNLYKLAQAHINFLLVIPGCAGAFRTKTFSKYINFEHDTLTEDLDFTFKMHKHNLHIHYNTKAIVYTQDPPTLKSYINQMRRWYCGGWQSLKKHITRLSAPNAAYQLTISYAEGLLFACTFFILPIINIKAFLTLVTLNLSVAIILGTYAAICRRRWDMLLVCPISLILSIINAWVFLEQFFKEIVRNKNNMVWFHPERRKITTNDNNL